MNSSVENSVKDKLRIVAKITGRSFNEIWKTLILERFLSRLAHSDEVNEVVLKGGTLLSKYLPLGRETVDLDFSIAKPKINDVAILHKIENIALIDLQDSFTFTDLSVSSLRHPHLKYPGYEIRLVAEFGGSKTPFKIDIGIGDLVEKELKKIKLLNCNGKPLFEQEISLAVYPLEYILAEKLETVVYRGTLSSRIKDFYDIYLLLSGDYISIEKSANIIKQVFAHRQTKLPPKLSWSTSELEAFQSEWSRFKNTLNSNVQDNVPDDFAIIYKILNYAFGELNKG